MGKGDTRQLFICLDANDWTQMTTGCSVTHLKKKGGAPKVRKVFDGAMRLSVPLKG